VLNVLTTTSAVEFDKNTAARNSHQCFDTVGWVTATARHRVSENIAPAISEGFSLRTLEGPGQTSSDLRKNRQVKRKLQIALLISTYDKGLLSPPFSSLPFQPTTTWTSDVI